MDCVKNVREAAAKLGASLAGRFPFPDQTRATTAAGRRAVNAWVMRNITSDSALHQFRQDTVKNKTDVTVDQNFADAFGNLGNKISAKQRLDADDVTTPLFDAAVRYFDATGVKDAYARKMLMQKVGELREALHAKERQAKFKMLKGKFVGVGASKADRLASAAEARKLRTELNTKYDAGDISLEAFTSALEQLVATYGIEPHHADTLGGMPLTEADRRIAELDRDPKVGELYARLKPYIDNVFTRVLDNNHAAGKMSDGSHKYLAFYGFEHYTPVYGVKDLSRLNEADPFDINLDQLNIAEGGIVDERIPFWPSMHIQLNASGKAVAENNTVAKLVAFAKAHGKAYGMTLRNPTDLYGVSEVGHVNKGVAQVPNGIPYTSNGQVTWVVLKTAGNKANAQLFDSIKNRMTQRFYAKQSQTDKTVKAVLTTAPARLFTNLNPKFWYNSMLRDPMHITTSVMLDPRIKNKADVITKMARFMFPTGDFNHKQALRYFTTKAERRSGVDSAFSHWMQDLADHGGETVHNRQFASSDYMGVEAGSGVDYTVPFDLGGTVQGLAGAAAKATDVGKWIIHKTGDMVTAFDMQARVSAYRALVESGTDRDTAAAIVREFMDFSQKGLEPSVFETLIPFYRTSTVAGYRAMETLFYNEAGELAPNYKVLGAMIAVGFIAAAAAKGDDDADGLPTGDKIPHSTAMSKFTFGFDEDGNAMSIPMPYGPASILYGLGVALERAGSGYHDPADVVEAFAMHAVKNLAPLSVNAQSDPSATGGDAVLNAVSGINPVLGDVARLVGNKDAFGRAIYTEDVNDQTTLKHASGLDKTPEFYKDMAAFLYEHLGADVHPESIQYLLKQWTPLNGGRYLDGELRRGMQNDLTGTDDTSSLFEDTVGSLFLDKSAALWDYNQSRKAVAMLNDIDHRVKQGQPLTPEMVAYSRIMKFYESRVNAIKASMRGMSLAQKQEAYIRLRQVNALAARASYRAMQDADWNILNTEDL